jgi:hypothetical protein
MAAFWPKEALSRVFKETDGPVLRRSGEDGAPSTRLSEKSDFKSWGLKMSNVSNEEKPYVEQIVDLEQEMKSK